MNAVVCSTQRCGRARSWGRGSPEKLARLTGTFCHPRRSLARCQALAARPAPRRHALPVRASRDAELKKMQEFKAGLNKHLEASKRPGATGEAPKACLQARRRAGEVAPCCTAIRDAWWPDRGCRQGPGCGLAATAGAAATLLTLPAPVPALLLCQLQLPAMLRRSPPRRQWPARSCRRCGVL